LPLRLPEIDFIDDRTGKPIGIHRFIGLRPVMAFGNSDGDLEMLQYTTAGQGPRFGLIVHHTDAEREWAYDRDSPVGRLDKALDAAPKNGWVVVDMNEGVEGDLPVREVSGRTRWRVCRGESCQGGSIAKLRTTLWQDSPQSATT
jgi:hypothetical protein